MLSKNRAKFIKSLQLKKQRQASGCFTVEGKKSVLEIMSSRFQVQTVVCTEEFLQGNGGALQGRKWEILACSPEELESVSAFKTNHSALAVARMEPPAPLGKLQGLVLALDGLRDPGNLGAILRIADWFGLPHILASQDTTEFYNPKVLQASMGSFCRVALHYADLENHLRAASLPVYAAQADAPSAHDFPFEKDCILLLGSESHGVSPALRPHVKRAVGIPGYGKAESLNVAAAAAILCDNYRRLAR